MKNIAVIDYGMSNLHSVLKSLKKVINKNYNLSIAYSSRDIEDASLLVLPGQGAANSCLEKLASDFPDLRTHIMNKPFLGICLGFQILFEKSYENNGVECFSLINGDVKAFGSIIRSFWWSTITLTTIGYGDVYPITIFGKIATIIIAIAGIGIVAIPAGIIAGGFSEMMRNKKK